VLANGLSSLSSSSRPWGLWSVVPMGGAWSYGTYGTPELGIVPSRDDCSLRVRAQGSLNCMKDVDDFLAELRVQAVFRRLRQCDDKDVAVPLDIEVFGRWNAVDCHPARKASVRTMSVVASFAIRSQK